MNENKSFFIVTFGLAAVLLLVVALFYTMRSSQEQASGLPGARVPEGRALVENQGWEKLKSKEFFEDEIAPTDRGPASVANLHGGTFSSDAGQPRSNKPQQLRRGSADALFVKSAPSFSGKPVTGKSAAAENSLNYGKTPVRSESSVGHGYAMGNAAASAGNTSDTVAQKSAVAFAPLMSKFTKKQAENLEKRLAKLPGSNGIHWTLTCHPPSQVICLFLEKCLFIGCTRS